MGILSIINELEMDQQISIGNFAATINFIDLDWAREIKGYLVYYGVKLTKASEQKYLTYSEDEIKHVLTKMQYCKDNGYSIVDENGSVYSYLFDLSKKSNFYKLYPDANLTNVIPDVFRDKQTLDESVLSSLEKDAEVGLTEENYNRYVELERKLTNVMQTLNGTGEIDQQVTNNLIKLINSDIVYSDKDILFAALVYNQNRSVEEMGRITNAIASVMESLDQGGTLNR